MFVRLTRRKRVKAGWVAALLYLFCVLAPGVALAAGDAASCLMTETETTVAAHVHGDSSHQHHAAQGNEHSGHHADAGAIQHQHASHEHAKHGHDKASPGPCCAMLCVSAITADLPAIAKPVQPISVCVSESLQRLPGEPPPPHYRPPIA
jgi:hypothetical protein